MTSQDPAGSARPGSAPLPGRRAAASLSAAIVAVGIAVFAVGVGVRWIVAERHFSHCDDVAIALNTLAAKQYNQIVLGKAPGVHVALDPSSVRLRDWGLLPAYLVLRAVHTMAINTTYAPLQGLFNYAAVRPSQSYRERLFWGRFPSLVEGVAAMALFAWLALALGGGRSTGGGLVALFFASASWMAIIHSGQMHSYNLGPLTATATLALLARWFLGDRPPSPPRLAALAAATGFFAFANYQNLFIAPAVWGVVVLQHRSAFAREPRRFVFGLGTALGLYALAAVPLVNAYLAQRPGAGANWNVGPHGEFLFTWPAMAGLGGKALYTLTFFARNTYEVFCANLAVVSPRSGWWAPVGGAGLASAIVGVASLARSTDPMRRGAGRFLLAVALLWAALVAAGKLTLSPTRHSLFLLPMMALAVGVGFEAAARFAARRLRLPEGQTARAAGLTCALLLFAVFAHAAPGIIRERTDRLDENELAAIFQRYGVDLVCSCDATDQLRLMPAIFNRFPLLSGNPPTLAQAAFAFRPIGLPPARTVAFVSHRRPMLPGAFPAAADALSEAGVGPPADYELLWKTERPSDVEIDISDRTKNGTNGLFIYILRKREPATEPTATP